MHVRKYVSYVRTYLCGNLQAQGVVVPLFRTAVVDNVALELVAGTAVQLHLGRAEPLKERAPRLASPVPLLGEKNKKINKKTRTYKNILRTHACMNTIVCMYNR